MAEFKFNCPQCKQHIVCDSVYVGSQINCPSCQQLIVVPPIPPSVVAPTEDAIQLKKSTVRKVVIVGFSVLIALATIFGTFHLVAGPKTVKFKAFVDGTEIIKLSGGNLWIEHQDWKLPQTITVNGKKWNPAWNDKTSMKYSLSRAFRPRSPASIQLTKQLGRGNISIAEMPSAANNQTLAIKIDDGDFGGAGWYAFTVSW